MTGPKRLAAILEHWKPGYGYSAKDPTTALGVAWAEAVGKDVARRTRPGKFQDGTLTIYTAGSTWSHQLTFLAPTILAALAEKCPDANVRRLRFLVATGRTKALLDGLATATGAARVQQTRERSADQSAPSGEMADNVEGIVSRLRGRQQTLDRRRKREGWVRCSGCSAWRPPAENETQQCAVCAENARQAEDGRIERVLANAPWVGGAHIALLVPNTDAAAYERVRRRLLTRWEEQMNASRRRLRRGELTGADRVVAWSYLMLLSGMQQHVIGRAVISDVLGAEWADALIVPAQPSKREAPAARREKQQRSNARVITRRNHT